MGKSAGSPPPAPDPKVTIAAQSEANADTARLQAQLNRVNQVGPTGQITYSQGAPGMDRTTWENSEVEKARAAFMAANPAGTIGPRPAVDYGNTDRDGNFFDPTQAAGAAPTFDEAEFRKTLEGRAPPRVEGQDQWTQTTTLSPEQQRLYDLTTQGQTTYGETANALLSGVQDQLSQPVNTNWEAERERVLAAQRSRLDPFYAQQEESLRQRLRNSGLSEGSEGWEREFRNFNQGRNDALLAADLRAGDTVGQGIQQTAALRGMPLNEASVLLSGGQVQTPQLNQSPQAGVAPTDAMGAYNQQYQGQMAAWQAEQQRANAGMGGLFGLAGTLGGAAMKYGPGLFALSDARAKKDIVQIGKAHNGLPLYAYRYKGSDTPQIGLMAQDVEKVNPRAVATTESGFKAVDYGRALLDG
jgi:hypothetical protein